MARDRMYVDSQPASIYQILVIVSTVAMLIAVTMMWIEWSWLQ